MPTETRDAYCAWYAERGDLMFDRTPMGTNRSGGRSHAAPPDYGRNGYINMGFWSGALMLNVNITYWSPEGAHETNAPLYFQDFPIPSGANVTDARMNLWMAGYGLTDINPTAWNWKLKVYGFAERPSIRFIQTQSAYHAQYLGENYAPNGSPRRWVVDSDIPEAAHTEAVVNWDYFNSIGFESSEGPRWVQTPNLAPILNEIVGKEWWKPGRRFCLVLAARSNEMWQGTKYPNGPADFGPPDLEAQMFDDEQSIAFEGTQFGDGLHPPSLTVTWE